jgi:hypothetical protein
MRQTGNGPDSEMLHDPLIYPGLYSPSGFDMMGILVCQRLSSFLFLQYPEYRDGLLLFSI